jgi:hypothetical protein
LFHRGGETAEAGFYFAYVIILLVPGNVAVVGVEDHDAFGKDLDGVFQPVVRLLEPGGSIFRLQIAGRLERALKGRNAK